MRTFIKKLSRSLRKRYMQVVGGKIKQRYFSKNSVKKLHIGCGSNILDGWLNSDCYPHLASVLHLDATKRFPFEDNTFDYVFSEHVIEHIAFSEGLHMLSECCRILKHNGQIRITTPDISFLIKLCGEDTSDLQREYIRWSSDNFIKFSPYYSFPGNDGYYNAIFVINNFVRDWGHKFIYDGKTLGFSLEKAGFKKVKVCNLNQSECRELRNLENEGRMPAGYLQLESLTLEGTKV